MLPILTNNFISANGSEAMELIEKNIAVKTVITKSNLPVCDYSVNLYIGCPHACKYCYASFMKRFTAHAEPWGTFIDVKHWEAIKNPEKFCGKELFIGSVTDPYNPQEMKYEKTRSFLKQLQGSGAKISIQTKSDLVLRDIDIIKTFPDARVGFSINTLDNNFKNDMDHAVSIERRLTAMKVFHEAGIRTTCFISPIFPGITDVEAIIDRVMNQCNLIWLENLNLRGDYKKTIIDYIREKYPQLMPLYDEIYKQGNRNYWENLNNRLSTFAQKRGLRYIRDNDNFTQPLDAPPTIVNFFYHEEVKKSAKKEKMPSSRAV